MGCAMSGSGPVVGAPVKPAQRDAEKRYIRLPAFDDAELAYKLEGEEKGPLVVCLHGIEGGMYVYDKLTPFLLEKGFRVLRPDNYGRGSSELPYVPKHSAAFYVEQVAELLKGLKLWEAKKIIIGHSMGGATAVCFAAKYPDYVDQLVLLAPAGFVDLFDLKAVKAMPCIGSCLFAHCKCIYKHNLTKSIYRPNRDAKTKETVGWINENLVKAYAHPGYFPAVSMSVRDFPLDNIADQAKAVPAKVRVLLLIGNKDGTGRWGCPYKTTCSNYKACIPHVNLVTFKDLHHLLFLEAPDKVHPVIEEFLVAGKDLGQDRVVD